MDNFETYLRGNAELLTYLVFFGLLLGFAVLEFRLELNERPKEMKQRWPVNFGFTAMNIVLLGAIPLSGLVLADVAAERGFGLMNAVDLPLWATFVAGILLRSFFSWLVHLAMHKLPFLWRIHRVHHSDVAMDVSTTVRFHPLEFLIQVPVTLAVIAGFGIPPVAILFYEIFDAGIAVFSHANVRLPRRANAVLRLFIVTPEMHFVHHSAWHQETDSNYGATLPWWDWLFGTYRRKSTKDLAVMQIGLGEAQDPRASSFWWLLTLPFRPTRIERATEQKAEL